MKILFLFFTTLTLMASQAPKTDIQKCLDLSAGKLITPSEAGFTVYNTCENCIDIPAGFLCQTYAFVPQSTSTQIPCSDIESPPENSSPTEAILPFCETVTCPIGEIRTVSPGLITCTHNFEILQEDSSKKAAYNAQKAAAESTSAVYQESQLYNNLQDYCVYTTTLPCPSMPPATFNATASSFSYITGKPLAEVKKLMKKKVKK